MACGFKTFIFIVAYCSHLVLTYDGCPKYFYGELLNKIVVNIKDNALENLKEPNAVNQIPTGKVNDDQRTTKR